MEPGDAERPRRRAARPHTYREYSRVRGGIAVPRATWYDIQNRLRRRNANGVPQDVIAARDDDVNEAAANLQAANGPDDENAEENVRNADAGEEALPEGCAGDGNANNGDNVPFLEALIPGEHDDELDDEALTVGDKNIERNDNLEQRLTPQLQRTKFETLLMVLNFAIRHSLTSVAIEDLLSMLNIITGSNLLSTSHLFKKTFKSDMQLKFHMYCPDCLVYVGEITQDLKDRRIVECRNEECRKQVKVPGRNGTDFFVTLPIGSQIADMLQNMGAGVIDELNYRWEREPSENIRDIYDGEIYKNLMKDGKFLSRRYNLSLTFSTDGATVFNSGCTSMWPIFFRLNELRPEIRFEESNTMLAGLWFGKREPQMAMYFNKFLGECRDLYEQGINWKIPGGQVINSKVIALNCVLDSGAKYMLQATKKFNGLQSCPYCDHPGVTYFDNNMCKWPMNAQRVTLNDLGYSYSIRKYDRTRQDFEIHDVYDRTNAEMRRDMAVAEARRREDRGFQGFKGLKSKSPLCILPFFDVCLGFQIDYMHNTLLGNCHHLASLWIESSSHQEDYYIGLKLAEIDERLLAITPPTSISRRPRSISQWKDWHANEWRSWLLYYSLPCLKGILPTVYYKHHCVLVTTLHILLRDNITTGDLDAAAEHLADYVTEFEVLYGSDQMFFNVHLLLHIPKSVLQWGPLWCYSMFSFESANNGLMRLVKGSTGVAAQIVSKYAVSKYLPHLVKVYTISDNVKQYCTELICYKRHGHVLVTGGVTLPGYADCKPLSNEERRAFCDNGKIPTNEFWGTMIKSKTRYNCWAYNKRGVKSDDSIARLNDETYAAIVRILRQEDGEVLLLMKKINTCGGFITCHNTGARAKHIKLCRPNLYGAYFFRNARDVVAKSIIMSLPTETYITDFPNTIEKD